MILPENQNERDFAFAVAAMTLRARAQDAAGDTEGAIVLSQARRDLESRGEALHGARNTGLLEFALVLANQEDKPQAFIDFLDKQDKMLAEARTAKREKAVDPVPANDDVEKPDPPLRGEASKAVTNVDPETNAPLKTRRRSTKKES